MPAFSISIVGMMAWWSVTFLSFTTFAVSGTKLSSFKKGMTFTIAEVTVSTFSIELLIEAITGYKIFKHPEKTNKLKPVLNTSDKQISFVPQANSEADDAGIESRFL